MRKIVSKVICVFLLLSLLFVSLINVNATDEQTKESNIDSGHMVATMVVVIISVVLLILIVVLVVCSIKEEYHK